MVKVLFTKYKEGGVYFREQGIESYYVKSSFYSKYYKYYQHFITGYSKWYQPHIYVKEFISWQLNACYFAPKELKRFDVDVVYLNSSVLSDWALAAKKENLKVVMHLRETFTSGYFGIRKSLIKKSIINNTDYLISISKYNAEKLGIDKNYKVVYNYADKRFFLFERKKTSPVHSQIKILYVGGYSYIKGFITIVNSIKYINNKNYQILFAGYYPEGKVANSIKRKIKYLFSPYKEMKKALTILKKTNKNITIVGLQDNIFELYNNVDILISPFSKPHFSRPIVEAFALGKIVISSDVDGIEEVVKNGVNGFLFKKDNPQDLAMVIEKVIKLPLRVKEKIIKNARMDAEKLYSSRNILKIEQIIDKINNYEE